MGKAAEERKKSLLPEGKPKYIRCYDFGGTGDRYTVVLTGSYRSKTDGVFWHIEMSGDPFHPQGMGTVRESNTILDRPRYSHLGKKIKFEDLPENARKFAVQVYKDLWDLNEVVNES